MNIAIRESQRKNKIEEMERLGYILINEHTSSYMSGEESDITLVFKNPREER